MAKGAARHFGQEDLLAKPIPEPGQKALAVSMDHGSCGAQQGDALADQPPPHQFPIMEMGGKQNRGAGPKTLDLGGIPGTGGNGGAIMTVKKAEEVQSGGEIKLDPEP